MSSKTNILRRGTPFIWLTGGALALSLLLVAGMLVLIAWKGLGFFWQKDLVSLRLKDGSAILGEIVERETIPDPDNPDAPVRHRVKIKQGNRDLYGVDFVWLPEDEIAARAVPEDALSVERLEWGNFYGYLKEVREGDKVLAGGGNEGVAKVREALAADYELRKRIFALERDKIGKLGDHTRELQRSLKVLEKRNELEGPRAHSLRAEIAENELLHQDLMGELATLRKKQTVQLVFEAEGGATVAGRKEKVLPLAQVVAVLQPNTMGTGEKALEYLARVWAFISDDPRESNTEGGVFPAIFGTVMMVMIMSIFVAPFGVLAAFYLREYAKQGRMVSIVRIAVNNLAGVPSIVFGVFGVGFFIYFVGAGIDRAFFPELSEGEPYFGTGGILWASLTLALMTVPVVIVATEEGLAAIPKSMREGSLALGATKFETTWSIVLPAVMPSVLTGLILAMARAAGEVAPLMITGVVKLAPSLPMDGTWPYVHLERKFMHLGFHIFDVGFQSPNVDAARPMVYATTLLLIVLVLFLNIGAIWIRNRLRQKYSAATSAI